MLTEILFLSLCSLALAILMMVVVWLISLRIHNAGIVDIAWAGGFSLLAILFAVLGSGFGLRKILIASMVTLWSLRLAGYLYVRVMGHHPVEDGRYLALRKAWGRDVNRKMFFFFQFQAILVVVLSIPGLLACINRQPGIKIVEWLGVALWWISFGGESLADFQLSRFKSDERNRGLTCQVGLWRYSRHPNYFFEWMIWVSYFVFALGSPWGFVSIYCPLVMLYFLLKVTGIPATEEQALRTKGDEYRQYQKTTSMFIPWFRKHA